MPAYVEVRSVSIPQPGQPYDSESRSYVQSLERGLAVLQAFTHDAPAMTLSEVARSTGLTRATARRLLLTLQKLGYVGCEGRLFRLRPKTLGIGYAYLSTLPVSEFAQPHIEDLSAQVHESSSAAVLDGPDIVYVARVPTKRIMTIALAIGSRLPAYATSMGRVLLADLGDEDLDTYIRTSDRRALTVRTVHDEAGLKAILAKVREQGFAFTDQELEDGVRSVAAPLRDAGGRAVAAINVSAHAGRVTKERMLAEFVPLLLEAAERISSSLRAR